MLGEMTAEKTDNQIMLVNVIEEIVKKKVRQLMTEYDMCKCEKCYCDACALVLNSLKPQYVTTKKGMLLELLSGGEMQYLTDLTVRSLNALKLVKNYPRH